MLSKGNEHGMTVSAHIEDPSSALVTFLDRALPQRGLVVEQWRTELRRRVTNAPRTSGNAALVGRAFEVRLALDLASRPAFPRLLSYLPPETCSLLLHAAGFVAARVGDSDLPSTDPVLALWRRASRPVATLDGSQVAALRACLDASRADWLDYAYLEPYPVHARRVAWSMVYGGQRRRWDDDSPIFIALRQLWMQYVSTGRRPLVGLGEPVIVQPVIVPGFATADLVAGETLVDVKAVRDAVGEAPRWLDQVLAYALLDVEDLLGIRHLAVYAGWQGHLLQVDLDQLRSVAAAGTTPSMADLRSELREILRDEIDAAQAARARTRHRQLRAWLAHDSPPESPGSGS